MIPQIQSLWRSLGRFPAHVVTWTLAAVFGVWAVFDVMHLHVSNGLAQSTYDAMVRLRFHARPADPRVVIVDIDESSLASMGKEFGQWPWPRDTLATVLAHIEKQQPAAVVWDVVFSDADLQNPGGDAAFSAVAQASAHSHFSVVRLPAGNDGHSRITRPVLPGLWATAGASDPTDVSPSTVALIPPALPGVAAGRLGYNNGYVDSDGVLRRYRHTERLRDGSVIQSIAASVQSVLNAEGYASAVAGAPVSTRTGQRDSLIAWRAKASAYPRVRFADVFAQAEGGVPQTPVPAFHGKVVIVGSTAPSLHDIHPTPLSPYQHGVDTLATVVDNAVNGHRLDELPQSVQALLACIFFVGIALWVSRRGVSSLAAVTFALPGALLTISYLSLCVSPVFIDLHLAAGLGLLLLAFLRTWNGVRRDYWCRLPEACMTAQGSPQPMHAWVALGQGPWIHGELDRLLSAVQHLAPDCRVVAGDDSAVWPARLNWPDLARVVAVIGPTAQLQEAAPRLQERLSLQLAGGTVPLLAAVTPATLFPVLFAAWSQLQPMPPLQAPSDNSH